MATTDYLSGNANYYLEVYAALQSQSVAGNYSIIYYRVRVYKTAGSGFSSTGNTGSNGSATSSVGALWSNGNIQYNFVNGANTGFQTFAEGTFRVNHNSNGAASYSVSASIYLFLLGSGSVSTGNRTLPSINVPPKAKVPLAPQPLGLDLVGMTSLRYQFQSRGDGGAPVLQWQIGYGTNSGTAQKFLNSSGTSTITGLAPGTVYYFWSRGRNSVGWGPWSSVLSVRTDAGGKVKLGGVWHLAVPYVKIGGVWKPAQPYVKNAGVWKLTE